MPVAAKNPYDQYKKTEISTANQGTLIVMLYDGAIKFLNIALENLPLKKYDIVNTNIIKAQDIVTELMLSLNMDKGGEIAQNLFSLYVYFKKRLIDANIKKEPEPILEVLKHLKDLRGAWEQISSKESRNDAVQGAKGSFSVEG
ncbi:MAG: flagellar export chaperone FliS [Spirochaetota bacterium]